MNRTTALPLLALSIALVAGCGSTDAGSATQPSSDGGGATTSDGGATINDGGAGGGDGSMAPATIAMPRISGGVPAFASGGSTPAASNDDDPATSWTADKLPAWIAYDLSGVPVAQRQNVVVAWNALHVPDYINPMPMTGLQMPTSYSVEINAAAGGGSPPASGWTQVANVTGNNRNAVEHAFALAGGNWVRMSVSAATDPDVAFDLDVFAAPNGASDCWMFMGDSITHITMGYAFSNLPQLVHQARADRWPALVSAAIGGTSTVDAVAAIDETLKGFPGRFVVLAYGTNDKAATFMMETLVQKVLAAGKVPVVPHMPWSDTSSVQAEAPMINETIDALYAKYPQIVRGPDLWAAFMNRTDLIPSGDIHPNGAGQDFLRHQWAAVMAAIP